MTVRDITEIMEKDIAPLSLAEEWDSPGLKTGYPDMDVSGVLVCLDADYTIIEEAHRLGLNMIVSHHPLIFGSVRDVRDDTQRALCAAVRNGISVYSAHTNLDYASGGINDALAEAAGITDIQKDVSGCHRFGKIACEMSLDKYLDYIKKKLSVPCLNIVMTERFRNMRAEEIQISKAGVSCGAFDGKTDWAKACGIDVLITGEIKHSDAILLSGAPFITIGAGHYHTEVPGVVKLAKHLKEIVSQYGISVRLSEAMRAPMLIR